MEDYMHLDLRDSRNSIDSKSGVTKRWNTETLPIISDNVRLKTHHFNAMRPGHVPVLCFIVALGGICLKTEVVQFKKC